MKKLWIFIAIVILAGCMTVRTYTIEKPRKDLSIEGNRGYLTGEVEEEEIESRLGQTRKMSIFEVEFGSKAVEKQKLQEKPAEELSSAQESFEVEETEEDIGFIEEEAQQKKSQYYTVQKNDTLQKISYKFYGTTKKWKLIQETNSGVIKNPDKLYPGMRLRIP